MGDFKLPGYSIQELIGTGGGSQIYRAKEHRSGRLVALKAVSTRQIAAKRYLNQVVNEYRVAHKFFHKNLIRITNLVVVRTFFLPRAYVLVMEYFDGKPLSELGGAKPSELTHVFACVARALAYMHSIGYVHADMKPDNVLVSADREVKLLDFGLACRTGTKKDNIQGTVDFIAPEQAGKGVVTLQTDIFNLGASMYKMYLKKAVPTSLRALSVQGCGGAVHYPVVQKANADSDLPQDLIALLNMCCEYDPARRPRNMGAVIFKLDMIREELLRHETKG